MKKTIRLKESQLISLIKKTINEIKGGYDDYTVMSEYAGSAMGILINSLNDLSLSLMKATTLIKSNQDSDSQEVTDELDELIFGIDIVKKDMNDVFFDFPEENVVNKGKQLLKAIDTLQENLRRITKLKSDFFGKGPEFVDKFISYMKDIMSIIGEYGDELSKTDEMYADRLFNLGNKRS
jgi:hypothetical protein